MFCQASAGVSLRNLVHLTDKLREELDPHHAVLGTTLQELGHVTDHWEQERVLLRPEQNLIIPALNTNSSLSLSNQPSLVILEKSVTRPWTTNCASLGWDQR